MESQTQDIKLTNKYVSESKIGLDKPPGAASIKNTINSANRLVFAPLASFCNRLPFYGKVAITATTYAAFKEKNQYHKNIKAIEAAGLLGFMIYLHSAWGVAPGITDLHYNMERFSTEPSAKSLLACGIDVAFAAANCAATYAQLHLSGRLAKHMLKENSKTTPKLSAWGINKGDIDYNQVAKKLKYAIATNNYDDIDTFFMILPKEKKQKVMENISSITPLINDEYSSQELEKGIEKLGKEIENKSRFRYLFNIIVNAHRDSAQEWISHYSFKQQLAMFIVSVGGGKLFDRLG